MTKFDYIRNLDINAFALLIVKIKTRAIEKTCERFGVPFKLSSEGQEKALKEAYEYLAMECDTND